MKAANNTLDETLALTTAANTVVQNPESVGTAFKTLSMRLRGAETKDIAEAGGDIEGMSMSISKLRDEILKLTRGNVDIMLDENTFKSTYQILKELSKVWGDIADVDQANLIEQIAGKRQGNVMSALMNNFKIAESALEDSLTSEGSAMREHEKAMDSVEVKANQVRVGFQELAQTLIGTDLVKGGLDFFSGAIDGLNSLLKTFGTVPTIVGAATASLAAFGDVGVFKKADIEKLLFGSNGEGVISTIKNVGFKKAFGLGKDNIKSIFEGSAFKTDASFTLNMRKQAKAVENYVRQAQSGVVNTDQLREAMVGASESTITYAEANKELFANMTPAEAGRMYKATQEAQEYSRYLSSTESGNMFQRASTMIKTYNENLKRSPTYQKEFNKAVIDNSKSMGKYLTNLTSMSEKTGKTTKASMSGYLKSSLAEGLKSVGTSILSGALNGLMGMGVSALLNIAGQGIEKLMNWRTDRNQALISAGADARQESQSIRELYAAYNEASSAYASGTGSKEAMTNATNSLVEALGMEASTVDELIAKYGNADAAMKSATNKALMNNINTMKGGVLGQVDQLKSQLNGEILFGLQNSKFMTEGIGLGGSGDAEATRRMKEYVESADYLSTISDSLTEQTKISIDFDYSSASSAIKSFEQLKDLRDAFIANYSQEDLMKMRDFQELNSKINENSESFRELQATIDEVNNSAAQVEFNKLFNEKALGSSVSKFEDIRDMIIDSAKASGSLGNFIYDDEEDLRGIVTTYLSSLDSMQRSYDDYLARVGRSSTMNARSLLESSGKFDHDDLFKDTGKLERQTNTYLNSVKALQNAYDDSMNGKLTTKKIDELSKKFPELAKQLKEVGGNSEQAGQKIKDALNKLDSGIVDDFQKKIKAASDPQQAEMLSNFLKDVLAENDLSKLHSAVDIAAEKTSFEEYAKAVKESNTELGLSSEAVATLRSRFAGLDTRGLFDYTTNGIKVNQDVMAGLNRELENTKKLQNNIALDSLMNQYDKLTEVIKSSADAQERMDAMAQRDALVPQIQQAAEAAAQYDALTSAYNRWISAQGNGDYGDMQAQYQSGLKQADTLAQEGKFGSLQLRNYLDAIYSDDLATAGADEIYQKYNQLGSAIQGTSYSIRDFMQEGYTGVENWLKAMNQLEPEMVKIGESGDWEIDISDEEAMAKQLGISTDYFNALLDAARQFGGIEIEGPLDQFEDLASSAQTAVGTLKELQEAGKLNIEGVDFSDFELNLDTSNISEIDSQIQTVKSALDQLRNEDGSINLDAPGAVELQSILMALVSKKQELSQPAVMNIDTSQLQGEMQSAISSVQELYNAIDNYNAAVQVGADTSEAEAQIQSAIAGLKGQDLKIIPNLDTSALQQSIDKVEVNGELKLDTSSLANIQSQIGAIDATGTVNWKSESSQPDSYASTEKDGKGTVTWDNDSSAVDSYAATAKNGTGTVVWGNDTSAVKTSFSATGTVKWTNAGGPGGLYGTAFLRGTSYAKGDWGAKASVNALVGEMGPELVVDHKTGNWYTVGDNGAEFARINKGDIVFNALQTRELLGTGQAHSAGGRGKAYFSGTAFAKGSIPARNKYTNMIAAVTNSAYTNTAYSAPAATSTSRNTSQASKAEDDDRKKVDWIEVALDRIQRLIDNIAKIAESTFKGLSKRLSATDDEISKIGQELTLQQQAYDRYKAEVNAIGLSGDLAQKVWDGTIDINEYDGDTAEKISEAQGFADAALDTRDAIVELNEELAKLYESKFDAITTDFENQFDVLEHVVKTFENGLDNLEERGMFASSKYYSESVQVKKEQMDILNKELDSLIDSMSEAIGSGKVEEGSEAWYDMQKKINKTKESIDELDTEIVKLNNDIRDLDWEIFDYALDRMDTLKDEASFLVDLLDFDKLVDDKGNFTDEGKATIGALGQQYNILMYQADRYGEEVKKINKEIANDPANQTLIERREEMLKQQQDMILSANDQKQAMIDLVEEGYDKELDALSKLIDEYKESLDNAKDLYDYQKKVKKQTDEIASLQKQQQAYEGDDSEETRARLQKIMVDLNEAQDDLQETEMEHAISEQKKMLDELYDVYEQLLNERLDNTDFLIQTLIDNVNADSESIANTLKTETDKVGYTMTDGMQACLDKSVGQIGTIINAYTTDFNNQFNSVNTVLSKIRAYVEVMAKKSDKAAVDKINAVKPVTPSKKEPPKQNKPAPTQTPAKPKTVTVGSMFDATGAPIYWDSYGKIGPYGSHQYYASDPKYYAERENNGYVLGRWYKSPAGAGAGWFKKSDIKAFKSGGLANFTGLAQLDGTPSRPEYVLNANDTENFFALTEALRTLTNSGFLKPGSMRVSSGLSSGNSFNGDIVTNVNIDHVENFDDLCAKMQDSVKFEKVIQDITLGRLNGKNSLNKYRTKFK